MEEEKKKSVPLSDVEREKLEVKNSLQSRAQEILNEQLDDVKDMNKMVNYVKCVSIRDKQLQEKKDIIVDRKNEEKRKDLMLEIERLKKIKYYEELEKAKKEEQIHGHKKIIE